MPVVINVHEAKTHLSRLLNRVNRGEEIVIAKSGRPCARLVPLEEMRERVPGLASGALSDAFFDPLTDDELAAVDQLEVVGEGGGG